MNKKTFLPLITGLLLCFIAGCKDSATPEKPVVVKQSINKTATTTPEPVTKSPATATQAAPQETQQVTDTEAPGQKKAADTAAPAPTEAPTAEASKETAASDEAPAAAPAPKEKAASETPAAPAEKETPPVNEPPDQTAKKPVEPASDTTPAEPPAATDAAMAPKAKTAPTAETGEGAKPVETETAATSLKNSLMEDDTTPPYDPTGKTDPFAALFSDKGEGGSASGDSEPKRALTPLEKIDISQLKLVAVLLAESGNRAMVEDGTGKPYILTTGTYIGINSGSVSKILKDRVVIIEKSKDILGRETSSTRELKLQKPLGED